MTAALPAIAQVGCGHWGKNLARNFAAIGVLRAVVDESEDTAAAIAAANGARARSLSDVLADPEIHAVAIATPAATHADVALRAIDAGKHVFVEKPLALRPVDGARVVDAAERAGRTLMVGHLLQYHPLFVRLKQLVFGGVLGELRYLYSNRLSLGKVRTEENVLWSFAPHDFSMILALAGEDPCEVNAHGSAILNGSVVDWCHCYLRFPSGISCHVQASWLHPFKEHRLVVVGEKATAVFEDSADDWSRRLAVYRHRFDLDGTVPVITKGEPEFINVERAEPLLAECRHFVECIRSGQRPRTDGREGLNVLGVLDQAEAALSASMARSDR